MEEALHKAITEVRVAKRCPGVDLLLKCDTSTKWFAKAFEECEIHLFDCRIQFDRGSHKTSAEKITGKRNGSNFANCLVRVRPEGPTGVTLLRSGKNGALR
jgi:hypothetical protein